MRLRYFIWIAVLAAAVIAPAVAQQPPTQPRAAEQVTVPLSDASRPGLIDISLVQGSIVVRGTNRKDVLVTARAGDDDRPRRRIDSEANGLTRLPQTASFRITEEANRVKVSSDSPNRSMTCEIEAPSRSTSSCRR